MASLVSRVAPSLQQRAPLLFSTSEKQFKTDIIVFLHIALLGWMIIEKQYAAPLPEDLFQDQVLVDLQQSQCPQLSVLPVKAI